MTDNTEVVNRALQAIGTRTTVTAGELVAQSTNEAIQANLILSPYRDKLLRMAPWSCAMNTANLVYITSVAGTPENTTSGTALWQPGQPSPGWSYEYQYPADCLRACYVIPQYNTGFAGGIPITTAVTGYSPAWCQGPPQRFKVGIDQFRSVTAVTIISGGVGYRVGDIIVLNSFSALTPTGSVPNGIGPAIRVLSVDGSGAILTLEIVSQILGEVPAVGGSLFSFVPNDAANTIGSASTTSVYGSGATFNIGVQANVPVSQRVILTNQEFATLVYVKQITDPNLMDPLFLEAWIKTIGAGLTIALTGDKGLAAQISQGLINSANNDILEARKADGNEGLTINDVTPDWIRARGINFDSANFLTGPYSGFEWGGLWSLY